MSPLEWYWFLLTNEGNGNIVQMSVAAIATGAALMAAIWLTVRVVTGRWTA